MKFAKMPDEPLSNDLGNTSQNEKTEDSTQSMSSEMSSDSSSGSASEDSDEEREKKLKMLQEQVCEMLLFNLLYLCFKIPLFCFSISRNIFFLCVLTVIKDKSNVFYAYFLCIDLIICIYITRRLQFLNFMDFI